MITCQNVMKIYKLDEDVEVMALQGLDLEVGKGEMMGIIGNSGSGKSTLLNMLGGLDRPTAGKVIIDDKDLVQLSDNELVQYKLETVGFIWQNNARNLIPYLTALENVELPMFLKGRYKRERAKELLEMVDLSHRLNSKLDKLSGGEQQRVAIAIALANNPRLLLADEPTGSVDTQTADIILDLFRKLNKELGVTIVIVTHDTELIQKMDRVVSIRDGRTSSEFLRRSFDATDLEIDTREDDTEKETHVELAVVDRAGRIQLPREYLDAIGFHGDANKLEVSLKDGGIAIFNPNDGDDQ